MNSSVELLCPQYPLSGKMFSATRPIYAHHKWEMKVPVLPDELQKDSLVVLLLYIYSIKVSNMKTSYSVEFKMFFDGSVHINVLILSWFLIEFTLLKAVKSDWVKISIKHIICYITFFDILHDFKITLQDIWISFKSDCWIYSLLWLEH